MNTIYFNNSVIQWLTTIFLILLTVIFSILFYQKLGTRLEAIAQKTVANGLETLVKRLRLAIVTSLILTGSYFSIKMLNLSEPFYSIFNRISAFLAVMLIIWIVLTLFGVIRKEWILPVLASKKSGLDKRLFRFLNVLGTITLLVWGISFGLANAGYADGLSLISTKVYGNTIVRWMVVIFLILATVFLVRLFGSVVDRVIGNVTKRFNTQVTDKKIKKVREVLALIVGTTCIAFILRQLILSEDIASKLENLFGFLIAVLFALFIVRIYDAIHHDVLVPRADQADEAFEPQGIFNHQLLPVIKLVITVVVWVLGIIIAMSNAGYDVGAVLAGLGVGGLAFALAAQDLVANMYGGVTILVQRPFKIGDRIKVAGVEGRIIEIGLRTTKINDFTGQQLTIPNRSFTDGIVTNVDARGCYYELVKLNLDTDSTADQIKLALNILQQISKEGELIEDLTWVSFDKVGEFSFQIEYTYAVKLWTAKEKDQFSFPYDKIIAGKTYVNLEILERFKANNLKLTFPVHTVDLRSDTEHKNSLFASSKTDASNPLLAK